MNNIIQIEMNNIISYPLFFNGLVKLYKDQKKVSR